MVSSLACNLSFGRKATPEPALPVTTEAVESLEESIEEAYQEAQMSGEIQLVITEAQITSLLTFELEKRAGDALVIENPQIYLRDGQIRLIGGVKRLGISATARVTVEVSVSADGKPVLDIVSASIGPFPIPGDFVSEVEIIINDVFQEQIASKVPGLFIESIVIENGTMMITGHNK